VTAVAAESVERALRAEGLLGEFNRAGVLGSADVHVARRLQRLCGESDDRVLLAAALAVRVVRHGSVVLELRKVAGRTAVDALSADDAAALPWPEVDAWVAAVERSPLVSVGVDGPADRPLRWVGGLLYLDRYWRQERVVAEYVDEAMLAPPLTPDPQRLDAALQRLFPADDPDRQRLAAYVAAHRRFSIVAGGPGTGKTTTVARSLAVLQDLSDGRLRVALAAPTGKAAARMTEAAAGAVADFGDPRDQGRVGILTASTLHRLLGSRWGQRTRFWHNRDNRLPYDVVVVDEASMVSLTMVSRLIEALRPTSRLILVGDPNQLSSIEVGAVLGDLVQRVAPAGVVPLTADRPPARADLESLTGEEQHAAVTTGVVRLTVPHRYGGRIEELAEAIRRGLPDKVLTLLQSADDDAASAHASPDDGASPDPSPDHETSGASPNEVAPGRIEYVDLDIAPSQPELSTLRADVVDAGQALIAAAREGRAQDALIALGKHRVLCAHREGPYGVAHWSKQVQDWLSDALDGYASDGLWYIGRPLLVTSNDYQLRLFNGDTGVIVSDEGEPRAAFIRDGRLELLAPSRLGDVQTVHAMSIHRSQGSQFDKVSIVLPPEGSPLLTRELLYTAVTRAKSHVRIIGTAAAVQAAVERPIVRASGLRSVHRPRRDA